MGITHISDKFSEIVNSLHKPVKPVIRDHVKRDIFSSFRKGGCLLLHESSAGSSCTTFNTIQYKMLYSLNPQNMAS